MITRKVKAGETGFWVQGLMIFAALLFLPAITNELQANTSSSPFHKKITVLCLDDHTFHEAQLSPAIAASYAELKDQLNLHGDSRAYLAWKTFSHPAISQDINLTYSLPSTMGGSIPWKNLPGELGRFPWADFLSDTLNTYGAVVVIGQLADDLYHDNPAWQVNLAKGSANWSIGYSKMFSKTMKISSIAIQVFDYTLNELGNAAVSSQKRMWYDAYKNYFDTEYGLEVKDMPKWDRLIMEHHNDMRQALNQMHKKFWSDDFRDSFKKQKYIWSNAEPSQKVKEEVRDMYLRERLPQLIKAYKAYQEEAKLKAVAELNSIYNGMVQKMNRQIVFSGRVTTRRGIPIPHVEVSLFNVEPVRTDQNGNYRMVFKMCELLPELLHSEGKIQAVAYLNRAASGPTQSLTRPLGTGFLRDKNEINDVQDRLNFVFPTDDVVKLILEPQNIDLETGQSANLKVSALQDDGALVDLTGKVEWDLSRPSFASVKSGTLTAGDSKGTVQVKAVLEKDGNFVVSNPCTVSIAIRREVEQLSIQVDSMEMESDSQQSVRAVAYFNDGTSADVALDPECTWSVDPSNLRVNQGMLRAGKAVIGKPDHSLKAAYTYRGKTVTSVAQIQLLPKEVVSELIVKEPEVTMGLEENVGLRATAMVTRGTSTYPLDVTDKVTWSASDPSVIVQTDGGVIVSGKKEGYSSVTAELDTGGNTALRAMSRVTVVDMDRPVPAPDFSVEPKEGPYLAGQSIRFTSSTPSVEHYLEYVWFLDGKDIRDMTEVSHRFDDVGKYTVVLLVNDPVTGKSDSMVKTVEVQSPEQDGTVQIKLSPEGSSHEIGASISFTATIEGLEGITGYRWYLSGELVSSNKDGFSHTFDEAGDYEIRLGLRMGSNFDEIKVVQQVTIGEAKVGLLGSQRNRFEAFGGRDNLEINSSYWRGGSADWSPFTSFNGSRIGAVRHYLLHTGSQADGGNVGYLVYVPEKEDVIRFKVLRFRWADSRNRLAKPNGYVHYSGTLPLHGKEPVWDSVKFMRTASRLVEVEWRCKDGSSCRARVSMYRSGGATASVRYDGMDDLGCEDGVYQPIEEDVDETDSGKTDEDTKEVESLLKLLKPGTYKVSTFYGPQYDAIWKLEVQGSRVSGLSQWDCCPAPRIDPLSGDLSESDVVILRDCSGQGVPGKCEQIYTGTLDGNTIRGEFTHDGRRAGTWVLYLDSHNQSGLSQDLLAKPEPVDMSGLWLSNDGHYVHVFKDGDDYKAVALENLGSVGWKEGRAGKLSDSRFSIVLNARTHFAEVSPDGKQITWSASAYWELVDANPSEATIEKQSFKLIDINGIWTSNDGHHVRIVQEGNSWTATPLENKGSVGWKEGRAGKYNYWDLSLLIGARAHFAKLSKDGNTLDWGGGNYWKRGASGESNGEKKKTDELRFKMKSR